MRIMNNNVRDKSVCSQTKTARSTHAASSIGLLQLWLRQRRRCESAKVYDQINEIQKEWRHLQTQSRSSYSRCWPCCPRARWTHLKVNSMKSREAAFEGSISYFSKDSNVLRDKGKMAYLLGIRLQFTLYARNQTLSLTCCPVLSIDTHPNCLNQHQFRLNLALLHHTRSPLPTQIRRMVKTWYWKMT
jgi:hypothetical protein